MAGKSESRWRVRDEGKAERQPRREAAQHQRHERYRLSRAKGKGSRDSSWREEPCDVVDDDAAEGRVLASPATPRAWLLSATSRHPKRATAYSHLPASNIFIRLHTFQCVSVLRTESSNQRPSELLAANAPLRTWPCPSRGMHSSPSHHSFTSPRFGSCIRTTLSQFSRHKGSNAFLICSRSQ